MPREWRDGRGLPIAPPMTVFSRPLRHGVYAAVLISLAAPGGTAVRKAKPRVTAPAPVKADGTIIPLPLNPIVPAAQRACTSRTANGLGYSMLRAAPGAMPAASDVVLVNYIGYLAATGAVFDQGMRSPFPVSGVIPGFSQGLQMMGKSGVARFCIPAALGYGPQGSGPIPANADLVFQVELIDYKTTAEIESMKAAAETTEPKANPQP